MAFSRRAGFQTVIVEFPDAQHASLSDFARGRGLSVPEVVRQAVARHLAFPPAADPPPFPANAAGPVNDGKKGAGR